MALRQSRTANCGLVLAGAGSARLCGEAAIAFDVDNSHSRPWADIELPNPIAAQRTFTKGEA
jgi:hypothetical protein